MTKPRRIVYQFLNLNEYQRDKVIKALEIENSVKLNFKPYHNNEDENLRNFFISIKENNLIDKLDEMIQLHTEK